MCKEKNKIFINKKTNHGGNWLKGKFKLNSKKKPLISIITVTLNSQKYLEQTLKRELEEEIGMIPDMEKIIPVHQYTSGDKKFVYNTFIVLVQEEFLPVLNNESDGYAWIKVNNWPRPLHPGVKNQLFNKEFIKKVQTVIESNTSGILN